MNALSSRKSGCRKHHGFSLIELMVAMTIGLFLLGGVFAVYLESQATRRSADSLARMQEQGRYALMQLSEEAMRAGNWGETTFEGTLIGQNGNNPLSISVDNNCSEAGDPSWALALSREVEAFNDSNPYSATCLNGSDVYLDGTDILVVRSTTPEEWTVSDIGGTKGGPGKLFIRSDISHGQIYEGGDIPPAAGGFFEPVDRQYQASIYYVRPWSFTSADGIPSLRRLVLADNGDDPRMQNEGAPVATGVEDFQLQLGIVNGSTVRYVDPDSSLINNTMNNVVSVRFWLLLRAEREEQGYVNSSTYRYANQSTVVNDAYRRILVTKTVQLRNLTEAN